jgi:hypothetical protein
VAGAAAGVVAGAGAAGVAAGGGAGVCAPEIKATAMVAPAIDCRMRFAFVFIETVPPKKDPVV